jgi:signal transduction histidine kinase
VEIAAGCPPPVSRRLIIGSTAAITFLVLTLLVAEYVEGQTGGVLLIIDVLAGGLGCALTPTLLRRPLPAALIMVGLACVSPAATPPATLAVLMVAQRRPIGDAVGVAVLGIIAHAVQALLRPPGGLSYGWWLILDVVAHAGLVAIGAWMQARSSLISSLVLRARRAEEEQGRRIAEARAAERVQIAREMHDVLAHRLSLVATYAGALEYRPDATPERRAEAAGIVRSGVQEALDELREVVTALREDSDDHESRLPQPTAADLPHLIEEARSAGTAVAVLGSLEGLSRLSPISSRTAYRLVQEALTNARTHARGQPVTLVISTNADAVLIEIRNPAVEYASLFPSSGAGIMGMTERVRLAGGRLDHGILNGEFYLRAALPGRPL